MVEYTISSLKPWQSRRLSHLLANGLSSDFSYFPDEYLDITKKQNRPLSLLVGSLRHRRIILVSRASHELVGYAISEVGQDGVAFLYWVYVHPNWRGLHIGQKLVEEVINHAKLRGSTMLRLATHDYEPYYKRLGFVLNPRHNFNIGQTTMTAMEKEV